MPKVICRLGGQIYNIKVWLMLVPHDLLITCLVYTDGKQRLPGDIVVKFGSLDV